MVEQDITLHLGADFSMTFVVPPGSDMELGRYRAVCKIRKRPKDDMILEFASVVQSNQVLFTISGKDTQGMSIKTGDYQWDAFLISDDRNIKIGQGTCTIVPDISLH